MNLYEILSKIDQLKKTDVIFAKKPWSHFCDCQISELDESLRVPSELSENNYSYFLEIPLVLEVLEVIASRKVSDEQKIDLLIFYAENDAYPEWVYESDDD